MTVDNDLIIIKLKCYELRRTEKENGSSLSVLVLAWNLQHNLSIFWSILVDVLIFPSLKFLSAKHWDNNNPDPRPLKWAQFIL